MWFVAQSNFDALGIRWSTMRFGLEMDAPGSGRCFLIFGTLLVLLGVVASQGRHIIIIYNKQSLVQACFLLCGLRFDLMSSIINCLTAVLELKDLLFIWPLLNIHRRLDHYLVCTNVLFSSTTDVSPPLTNNKLIHTEYFRHYRTKEKSCYQALFVDILHV